MSFLPDLLTKLKNMGTVAAGFLKALGEKGVRRFSRIREYVFQKELFRGRKRVIFIGLGALLVLALCSLLVVLLVMDHNADAGLRAAGDENRFPQRTPVPPEELFLPAEPDFLPGVMLERERRQVWTAEDAEPYWQDPLKSGEEPWRDRAEAVIDELLERVP
jgi:hypothetical protein